MIITSTLLWSWSVRSGSSLLGWVGHRNGLRHLVVVFNFVSFSIFIFKASSLLDMLWSSELCWPIQPQLCCGLMLFLLVNRCWRCWDWCWWRLDGCWARCQRWFCWSQVFNPQVLRINKPSWADFCLKRIFGHKKTCRKRQAGWWGKSIYSKSDPFDRDSLDTTQYDCDFFTATGSESVPSRHRWGNWCTICTSQLISGDFGRVMGIVRHRLTAPSWAVSYWENK